MKNDKKIFKSTVLVDFQVGTKGPIKYLKGSEFTTKCEETFKYLKSVKKIN